MLVPEALVFATRGGTALDADNLRRRVVKPLMEEAGAPWAAFHTLRHTYASLQLAAEVNIVQLSRARGHHSAAFTAAMRRFFESNEIIDPETGEP